MEDGKTWKASVSSRRKTFLICLLLFGLTFLVFLPATQNAFLNYDDNVYVTENPHVQSGPTWANLKWAFTTGHAANWHPLTWLSHMADCWFYGPKPAGHHLTSVLLHALNTMLLFLVLQRMTDATWRSLVVALLFGLHPLRVESVAWVAERKDVLSGFFFMLTLLAYAQYVRFSRVNESKSHRFYFFALAAFVSGLMSKPMLVTVPFVLLLLDWWPLKRFATDDLRLAIWNLFREKIPFFLLSALSCVVTFKIQQSDAAVVNILPFAARVENVLVSYGRYISKLFWPVNLAVYYPHPNNWPLATVLTCAIALALASWFAISAARKHSYFTVGWFWFLGMLVPVIGLVQVGTQSMADRYTYLPMIGILVLIVWGIHEVAIRRRPLIVIFTVIGATTVFACVALTFRQIGYWRDSETLFRHALAATKENSVAHDNLGRALGEKGQLDEAMEQYQAALELNANDPYANNGLGVLLMKKRNYAEAAEYLRKTLALDPKNAIAHYNLGLILANWGSLDEAIRHFEETIRFMPDYAEAHNNLGGALAMQRRFNDAIPHYRQAIRLKPNVAIIHKNLGVALLETGQLDEAIDEFREAISLQADFTEAQTRLQTALRLKAKAMSPAKP